jgi:hypothetical protein
VVGGVNDQKNFSKIFADSSIMQILLTNLVADEQWWAVSMTSLTTDWQCQLHR